VFLALFLSYSSLSNHSNPYSRMMSRKSLLRCGNKVSAVVQAEIVLHHVDIPLLLDLFNALVRELLAVNSAANVRDRL